MVYSYKEYRHIFDTPAKKQQETVIVNKIMELLNGNKYDNIEDFINKNQTYEDFLKNNHLENVVKHFGNTLNEQDFRLIQEEMKQLTERKKNFEQQNLKTTKIGDKEYNTFEGQDKTFFLDNSHSDMSIERQMEVLQGTQQEFQTADQKQNAENMMAELEDTKKESLNLHYLKDIKVEDLNEAEKAIFTVAANYQLDAPNPIRVDLARQVIVDEFNTVRRIEKAGENYNIVGDSGIENSSIQNEASKSPKTFQKTLTPSPNTMYSNNNE